MCADNDDVYAAYVFACWEHGNSCIYAKQDRILGAHINFTYDFFSHSVGSADDAIAE